MHAQAAKQAAPAKPAGQESKEAERTAPPPPPAAAAAAPSPSSVPESGPSGGAEASLPTAGELLTCVHALHC